MYEAFDEIGKNVDYRIVYRTVWHIVQEARLNLRAPDASRAKDVAWVGRQVRDHLRKALDSIDPGIVSEAISDAMSGRNPRW